LVTEDTKITAIGQKLETPEGADVIDCKGKALAPGIIDMQAFALDGAAAAAGGITTVALMPNLDPAVDNAAMVDYVLRLGRDDPDVRVRPIGAATKALAGQEIAEIGLMQEAGAVAFASGREALADSAVMLRLLSYGTRFDALIIQHGEDPGLTADACMTEGELATRLGLSAAPRYAEAMMIERDMRLVEGAGGRYHVAQLTTRESIDVVARAKKKGIKVSAGVTPAHFLLNEMAIGDYRTFAKMSPPLREEMDRRAVLQALADGVIDVITSGHDPRNEDVKRLPFAQAAVGMVGFETLLPCALKLYHEDMMSLPAVIAKLTSAPAKLLSLETGRLEVGAPADLMLFDPDAPWTVDADKLRSAAKNTPFDGLPVQGKILRTICDGYDSFVAQ
jgi:dihydroorotase